MNQKLIDLRKKYHQDALARIIRLRDDTYPNFADRGSAGSVAIAKEIIHSLGGLPGVGIVSEQSAGDIFEELTKNFLEVAFARLAHLRPGNWRYSTNARISDFDQYTHIARISEEIRKHKELAAVLRGDYIITPDIVIGREPITLANLNDNQHPPILEDGDLVARHTPLIQHGPTSGKTLLHASISCKWTLRSDRSQNVRTEALNLIRNRKGHLPHVAAVTAEPLPMRIASLALGTGELDCVYHFALYELEAAVQKVSNEDQQEMLATLIDGRRLRDISDLPLDLAI